MCPCQDGARLAGIGGANVRGVDEGAPISVLMDDSLEIAWNISGLGAVLAMSYYCKGPQIPSES